MSVIDTLITDRSAEDVAELLELLKAGELPPEEHKGAYNAFDLNRVGEAVAYVRGRLAGIGIRADGEELRADWTAADIPCQSEMAAYLGAVAAIREKVREYRPGAALPESMRNLSFNEANDIESLLRTAEETVRNVALSYRGYSGRLRAGGGVLP